MTGKMSMAGSQDEVLKQSWMTKRSQLKSRYSSSVDLSSLHCSDPRLSWTNYKERWFCLTRSSLVYYDGDDEIKKKEKGRIYVRYRQTWRGRKYSKYNILCAVPTRIQKFLGSF